ncbi:hypothetical protein NCH01_15470 [Neoasaia chiangmaiensis]|nr:hypothetical protein NCH01_15470 [Neoasaia chiangmaiensis]
MLYLGRWQIDVRNTRGWSTNRSGAAQATTRACKKAAPEFKDGDRQHVTSAYAIIGQWNIIICIYVGDQRRMLTSEHRNEQRRHREDLITQWIIVFRAA